MSYCSPIKSKRLKNSCFDNNQLISLANAYNQWSKNNTLYANAPSVKYKIKLSENPTVLYNNIYSKLKVFEPKEYNWVNLPFVSLINEVAPITAKIPLS